MTTRGTVSVLVSVLSALAVLMGKSLAAEACTLSPYEDVFVPSGTVPADGFAAEIGDPSRSLPTLADEAGNLVELAVTQGPGPRWTVRSAKALVAGAHYIFRFQQGRRFDSAAEGVPQTIELTAGPTAPAPKAAGVLRVEPDLAVPSLPTYHLIWERDLALQPYSSLLETHYLIDEEPLSSLASDASGQAVHGVCDRQQAVKDSCGGVSSAPAGRHTLSVTTRLFGSAAPLPTLSAVVDIQCLIPYDDVVYPPGCGCGVADRPGAPGLPAIAVAALGLCLLRTRRRRPPS